ELRRIYFLKRNFFYLYRRPICPVPILVLPPLLNPLNNGHGPLYLVIDAYSCSIRKTRRAKRMFLESPIMIWQKYPFPHSMEWFGHIVFRIRRDNAAIVYFDNRQTPDSVPCKLLYFNVKLACHHELSE